MRIQAIAAAGVFFAAISGLCAQSGAAPPEFEAAAVKPVGDPSAKPMDFRVQPGGRLQIMNVTLKHILQQAFSIKAYQMSGGPSWIDADYFDIAAKAESATATREQMMAMLQSLLAARFGLKFHWEEREGNVFTLTVAKNGPKLQAATGDKTFVGIYRNTPMELPGVNYTISGTKAPMSLIAERIGDMALSRPVQNRTGIEGEFDFKLNYALDESGPSIFMAVQDQLGLKLEATKGPIRTLIVDHAEKPAAN